MESSEFLLLIGYLAAFGSMITDVLSASCTQALEGAIPDFQLSVARSMVQSIVFITGGKLVGANFKITKENIPGFLNLGVACLFFNVGYYGATTYLPLVEVRGALIIAQITTAFLHSRLLYYIDIPKTKIISLLVCVVGITLTAQPSWLFNNKLTRNSDVAAHTSIMIGDTFEADILGAENVGMDTIFYNYRKEVIPATYKVVDTLLEIKKYL